MTRTGRPWAVVAGVLAVALLGVVAAQSKRDVSVSARKYAYNVDGTGQSTIRVPRDTIVRVSFTAEDIPHSFTIDEYRISRRAEAGKAVSFEFHANRTGEFRIYCNLTIDDRCRRELHGTLIVDGH